ncbi:MAG: hypothetical protein R3Y57_01765 [Erysipelotrichaceae bacterium]
MEKKRIFICSTGRTATQFFAKYLNKMIDCSVSIHEPGTPWLNKGKLLLEQLHHYGFYHLTFGQGLNTHSMYKLSRDYVAKEISNEKACENIKRINNVVDNLYVQEVIVYSSGHIYGLLGLLDEVYEDSRFIFIIRDPRDWISSALNKTLYTLYGPLEYFYHHISLQPSCIKDDPYIEQWSKMSKFEKYCWFYNKLNQICINDMQDRENFKIYKYEDLFISKDKAHNFESMLNFATDFKSGKVACDFKSEMIDNKIDSKQKKEVSWHDWTSEQVLIMEKHCGNIMRTFGYGEEDVWRKKIQSKSTQSDSKLTKVQNPIATRFNA